MKNYLTIDFEEWYQGLTSTQDRRDQWQNYEDRIVQQATWMLLAMDQHKIKATFFIIGQVARDNPELIRLIVDEGHEIGLHGDMHKAVYRMNREEFREDLNRNWDSVVKATGKEPVGYRAAYASLSENTEWIWEELMARGIQYDSSVFPIKTPLYGMPDAPRFPYLINTGKGDIPEMPISTIRPLGKNLPFSGGFYFRALPYSLIRAITRNQNQKGIPVTFYFHPWEFDATHPRPDCVTSRERLSHYGFLRGNKKKFLKLLRDFEFTTLGSAASGLRTSESTIAALDQAA